MSDLIKYITAGFLSLVIVFAAFSADIILLYEKSLQKEDISLAADAGMEKKSTEIKELSPGKEFISDSSSLSPLTMTAFKKTFCVFKQPYIHKLYNQIPTPPPRPSLPA
ncbi:hypothetical protein [Niabella beijingensis]|uniref:hypothetical protein n=1 Tax=Niabella beijingensis TaxID=2872700 RepID=UPI001CBA7D60|nr:hypothetical protein [Niabella beijingensis]MBZ4188360.1 hypothetical protein [Niabella beijingensis]